MPIRSVASALLLFLGVAHVVKYVVTAGAPGPGILVFGAIYFALGLLLRRPGAWPLWLAVVLPVIGGLGGSALLRTHFDPIVAFFVAIEATVVACCLWLIVRRQTA